MKNINESVEGAITFANKLKDLRSDEVNKQSFIILVSQMSSRIIQSHNLILTRINKEQGYPRIPQA